MSLTTIPAAEEPLSHALVIVVGLLIAASLVAVVARRIPVPYVSSLAIAGAALGTVASAYRPEITSSLILFIVLPGLLFESAFNLSWARLRQDLVPVAVLATAGVAVTMAVVALLGHTVMGLTVSAALVMGAAVAPTDPVAVIAVFRRLRVPRRLTTLVEGESLLNDGTGVVAFGIALTAGAGGSLAVGDAMLSFLRLAGGGLALGAVVGFVLSHLTRRVDDEQIELTFTAIGAYGTYALADAVHVSGILAVVAAAMVLGNYGRARGMSERTRAAVDTVWGYAAFVLNSLVFLLIGLTTPIADVLDDAGAVAAAACITEGRLLEGAMESGGGGGEPTTSGNCAVAVALALSIGEGGVGGLGRVRTLVYGVVLLSIVVQGATVAPLITRLIGRDRHTARPRAGSRGGGRRRRPSSAPAGGGNQPPG